MFTKCLAGLDFLILYGNILLIIFNIGLFVTTFSIIHFSIIHFILLVSAHIPFALYMFVCECKPKNLLKMIKYKWNFLTNNTVDVYISTDNFDEFIGWSRKNNSPKWRLLIDDENYFAEKEYWKTNKEKNECYDLAFLTIDRFNHLLEEDNKNINEIDELRKKTSSLTNTITHLERKLANLNKYYKITLTDPNDILELKLLFDIQTNKKLIKDPFIGLGLPQYG